jgi:energy-coupling factor transport system ATP-binding protein
MARELLAGANFSGRSEALREKLQRCSSESFLLGPYAEAALSGLSSTVADEIAIYARADDHGCFAPIDWSGFGNRKPATLSGGEQVLLALHCFSRSKYRAIGVDTALEQLDAQNRAAALRYLSGEAQSFEVVTIDNRIEHAPPGWAVQHMTTTRRDHAIDLAGLALELQPRHAPVITVRGMDFGYRSGRAIFSDVDLSLQPGRAYRLLGANGAGKTTFFKILVGVLAPGRGAILLDDTRYQPRGGNRVFALATQNPDHQWCGATLGEDLARRRRALGRWRDIVPPSEVRLISLAHKLGVQTPDQLLYELPLAARKRLSWLWPFSGAMPWLMLDEPTIGQDRETRIALAAVVSRLCELGHGVMVVTHDDDFAGRLAHQPLRIEEAKIIPL